MPQHRKTQGFFVSGADDGSITVLYCWLLVMIIGVVTLTLNVAGIFTYHAHLQTSSDCSAYSGAAAQARGLNEIAKINNGILRDLRNRRDDVWRSGRAYGSRSDGERAARNARDAFERSNRERSASQRKINETYPLESKARAATIAMQNQSGLGTVEFSAYPNSLAALTNLQRVPGESQNFSYRYYYYYWVTVGSGENRRRVRRRGTSSNSGPTVTALVYQKNTRDHTYFSARLLQPFQRHMFEWMANRLGGIERIRTYATAMPYGGYLWDGRAGRANYDVKLVRTGDVRPRPALPDGWGYDW